MLGANPVGVREVDADRSCRVGVAGKDAGCDNLGRYTFHFIFLEACIDWRVLFKPFRIVAKYLGAVRCAFVLEVDN